MAHASWPRKGRAGSSLGHVARAMSHEALIIVFVRKLIFVLKIQKLKNRHIRNTKKSRAGSDCELCNIMFFNSITHFRYENMIQAIRKCFDPRNSIGTPEPLATQFGPWTAHAVRGHRTTRAIVGVPVPTRCASFINKHQ